METVTEEVKGTISILKGHVSPETAYVVDDYPYGYRLRCKIRYWIEYKPKFGFRFMSQTTNPKKSGEVWNKSKAGIYSILGMCMFLNEEKHVSYACVHEYSSTKELQAFQETYGEGITNEEGKTYLRKMIAAKISYDEKRDRRCDIPLSTGLKEAHKAFSETK